MKTYIIGYGPALESDQVCNPCNRVECNENGEQFDVPDNPRKSPSSLLYMPFCLGFAY